MKGNIEDKSGVNWIEQLWDLLGSDRQMQIYNTSLCSSHFKSISYETHLKVHVLFVKITYCSFLRKTI